MTRSSRPSRPGALVALMAALATGASLLVATASAAQARPLSHSVQPAAAATPSDDAELPRRAARRNYQVPTVGSCHALSARQLLSSYDTLRPVPCSSRHNLRTLAVKRLTRPIDYEDFQTAMAAVAPACERARARMLGRTDLVRSQSAYDLNLFVPTPAQRRRGAAWVRCDIGIFGGRTVVPLSQDLRLPAGRLPRSLTGCLDARRLYILTCSRPHSFRAVGAVRLRGGFPTPERAREQARGCNRFIKGRGTYRYALEPLFRAGNRALVCYQETRR